MAASWGGNVVANSWQQFAGSPTSGAGMPMHPKLYQAIYGADMRRGMYPMDPSVAMVPSPEMLDEEIPTVFSAKSFAGLHGELNSFEAARATGFAHDRMAGTMPPNLLSQDLTTSGALPYGDPCWVTVFGFPGRAAGLVRQQLEMLCGPIVESRYGDGNFLHIRFQTASAASQCLARNGHPLVGNLLIGCVPCTAAAGLGSDGLDADPSTTSRWRGGDSLRFDWDNSGGRNVVPPGAVGWAPRLRRQGFLWRVLDTLFNI
mmetsp:Transcript_46336/g.110316  ORF Transcript_46336/g.110316 Transcript_46336/m.110316 type:complete len:260 (-) Transcript_46336:13-792(-)